MLNLQRLLNPMITDLLSKLDKVRQTGSNTWTACCPAHKDRSASLSIRDADGKVLLHCFAGCSVAEVIGAIGMELSDLFPPKDSASGPVRNPFPATDALRAIAFESLVVVAAAKAVAQYPGAERERLLLAAERINSALSATGIQKGTPWTRV